MTDEESPTPEGAGPQESTAGTSPSDEIAEWLEAAPAQPGPGQTEFPFGLTVQSQTWSGPVPPPPVIKQLNEIEPGLGTGLVKEFTNEAEHRRQLEVRGLRENAAAVKRGQWFTFVVLLIVALGAIVLGMNGHTETAIALAAMDVGIPAAVFVIRGMRRADKDSDSS